MPLTLAARSALAGNHRGVVEPADLDGHPGIAVFTLSAKSIDPGPCSCPAPYPLYQVPAALADARSGRKLALPSGIHAHLGTEGALWVMPDNPEVGAGVVGQHIETSLETVSSSVSAGVIGQVGRRTDIPTTDSCRTGFNAPLPLSSVTSKSKP